MAVFISGAFIVLMAMTLPIEDIASATDAMFLLLFIFVNMAVINLRKNRPDLDRGFKVPLFPFIPILATFLNLFLAVFLFFYRPLGVWVCIGYICLGIFIYYVYSRKKEFTAKAAPAIHTEQPVFQEGPYKYHILVPVANKTTVQQLQHYALTIAKQRQADITALNVIKVPSQLPPSEGRKYLNESRVILDCAIKAAEDEDVPISSVVKVTHNIPKAIIETCEERNIDLMVLGWEGEKAAHNRVFGTILDEIILNTVCDIVLICRPPERKTKISRILIPVSTLKYAVLSLQLAEIMTKDKEIPIVLFHATYRDEVERIKEFYEKELSKLNCGINPDKYEMVIKKTNKLSEAIIEETQNNDLVIMGAPEEGLVRRAMFGDIPLEIARKSEASLILTKKYTGHVKTWFQKFFGSRKTMLE